MRSRRGVMRRPLSRSGSCAGSSTADRARHSDAGHDVRHEAARRGTARRGQVDGCGEQFNGTAARAGLAGYGGTTGRTTVCGIVAYIGSRDSVPILLEGLARLEYRGYDSHGLAVLGRNGDLRVRKAKGRVAELTADIPARFKGSPGIGHTRWATHGEPSDANAHPHACGSIAIVHNGIIENADELRAKLAADGAQFASETDSELFAHLIAAGPADDLEEAVRAALKQVVGTYGLAVVDGRSPDRIVVARNGSPVLLGIGDKEMFVAS